MTLNASACRRACCIARLGRGPGAAITAVLVAQASWGMGSSVPPPAPVEVRRAAPARPDAGPARAAEAGQDRSVPAQGLDHLRAAENSPEALLFRRRVLVIFADTPDDPAFALQMAQLESQPGPLAARNVVVLSDSDPAGQGIWRQRLNPHGFSLVLIDEDGQVKQRKPQPWDVREIARAIDLFPTRREELRTTPAPGPR